MSAYFWGPKILEISLQSGCIKSRPWFSVSGGFRILSECRVSVNRLLTTLGVVFALDSRRANCPTPNRSQDTCLTSTSLYICYVNVTSTEGQVCWLLL